MNNVTNSTHLTVKALRERQNLTQQDVAEILRCSVKSVSSWDNARQLPKIDNAAKLARLYKVSLPELFEAFNIDVTGIPENQPTE
ncbi:MAG: helix-turn-helix transcriptional regulator [Crocosphaera sp.]|nr:helix-turn-helix transcriptional regulator [Crocosphaera sp.]